MERVLYAKPKVIDTVFSADDLERINSQVLKLRIQSEHIFVMCPAHGSSAQARHEYLADAESDLFSLSSQISLTGNWSASNVDRMILLES